MAEPDNITLLYLRRIDAKIDRIDGRPADLALRVNEVHSAVIGLRRDQVLDT